MSRAQNIIEVKRSSEIKAMHAYLKEGGDDIGQSVACDKRARRVFYNNSQ